jgi:hypothetical protein
MMIIDTHAYLCDNPLDEDLEEVLNCAAGLYTSNPGQRQAEEMAFLDIGHA